MYPVATNDPALGPGEIETLSARAPADTIAEETHEVANAAATAASPKTPPSDWLILAVAVNEAVTF